MNIFWKSVLIAVLAALLAGCAGIAQPAPEPAQAPAEAPQEEAKAEEPATDQDVLSGEDLEALIAAAEEEGTVVAYSFTSRIAKVEKAFEEAYPNIDLVGFDISSTE